MAANTSWVPPTCLHEKNIKDISMKPYPIPYTLKALKVETKWFTETPKLVVQRPRETTCRQPPWLNTAQVHWGSRVAESDLWTLQAPNPSPVIHWTPHICTWPMKRRAKRSHLCRERWKLPVTSRQSFQSLLPLWRPAFTADIPLMGPTGQTDLSLASCLLAWPPCSKAFPLSRRPLPPYLVFLSCSGQQAHLLGYTKISLFFMWAN